MSEEEPIDRLERAIRTAVRGQQHRYDTAVKRGADRVTQARLGGELSGLSAVRRLIHHGASDGAVEQFLAATCPPHMWDEAGIDWRESDT